MTSAVHPVDGGTGRTLPSRRAWVMTVPVPIAIGAALGTGLEPLVIVGALVMTAALAIAARRIDALVALALLALFLPSFRLAGEAPWALTLRWVLLGVVLLALTARLAGGRVRWQAGIRAPVSLVAFTAFAAMTVAWSMAPRLTIGRSVSFVSMIVIIVLMHRIDGAAGEVATAFRWVGAVLAFGGLIAVVIGTLPSGRYAGLFANPNTLGTASALLFPFALLGAFESRLRWARVANGLTAALLVGQAAAAASRGGLLAVTAAYLYLGRSQFRRVARRTRLAVLLLPALLGVVISFVVIDPNRLSLIDSRTILWGIFPQVFLEQPLLGHGFGTTQLVLRPFAPITGYLSPGGVDFHNSYFNVLSDMGTVGGILFGALLVRAARRHLAHPALTAVIIAGVVSAVFESWLLSVGSGFSFVFWFALIGVAGARRRRGPNPVPPRTAKLSC